MIFDVLLAPAIAGLALAMAAAPLGCFLVWRRMAFFGDATAHTALLGVAIALLLDAPIFLAVLVVAAIMAMLISRLDERGTAPDTFLGVISHSALAAGLLAVSLFGGPRVDLEAFLFGDILALSWQDVIVIAVGALVILGMMRWRWRGLLITTMAPEIAVANGLRPKREQLWLLLALAGLIALALKLVGALLISALLIIPAAAARGIARTPEAMVMVTAALGALSVLLGLGFAWEANAPPGPSIVMAAATLYLLSAALTRK